MGRGAMHGTFYVPSAPRYINKLDVSLGEHGNALVRRIHGLYPAKLADAVFSALDARVGYNVDNFERDERVNPAANVILTKVGEEMNYTKM